MLNLLCVSLSKVNSVYQQLKMANVAMFILKWTHVTKHMFMHPLYSYIAQIKVLLGYSSSCGEHECLYHISWQSIE